MSIALRELARNEWIRWGAYAMWSVCRDCREWCYCRSRSGGDGPWLCLDCFDQR